MKTTPVFFLLLMPGIACYAQEQKLAGRFVKFDLQGSNDFDVRSYMRDDVMSFNSAEYHSLSTETGYGWFYKNKRSVYFGAGTDLTYQYTRNSKRWSNTFYGTVQRASYKNIYQDKIFFSLSQAVSLAYSYSRTYSKTEAIENPDSRANTFNLQCKPGILYRYSKASGFTLQFDLISLQLVQQQFRNGYNRSESTIFRYSLLSNYNLASLQIGYLWMPSFIQPQRK